MKTSSKRTILSVAVATVILPAIAHAGTSVNSSGNQPQQGAHPAITISLSGQTALRNFTASPGVSTLQPGGSITLNYGATGGGIVTYYASNSPSGYVQLATPNFTLPDTGTGATSVATAPEQQNHSAFRIEWHEQGSVQGQIDLINDQVGYVTAGNFGDATFGVSGILSNEASRGPSLSNRTFINTGSLSGGGTFNGIGLSSLNFANTYNAGVYDLPTGRNKSSGTFTGLSGQDRIQIAIGEYKTEGLARSGGAASPTALPGAAGYGLGNPALAPAANTIGLGIKGGRQQLYDEAIVNQSTDKVDPTSATGQHYTAGPWNTAGANNIDSKQIAVTAVTISANPGSGLNKINKGDAQWLQTAGRLQNGAEFNVVTRANDAGQRIVPAVNSRIDPSWAVGENDDGNTSGTALTNIQKTLGAGIRFSGKTAGGESRNAIAQSRLGVGPLSLAEARGAASNAPVRTLRIAWDHLTDAGATFVEPTFDNIVNFTYKGVLISHYNTIKKPRPDLLATFLSNNPGATPAQVQTWWNNLSSAATGIKGDPHGNVQAFINNIAGSIGSAASGTITVASANNPADALFAAGFLIPGLLNYSREFDGGPLTPNNLTPAQLAVQANVNANYGFNFTADGSSGSNSQTTGVNAFYGALNAGTVVISGSTVSSAINGGSTSVLITAKNFLFGNFNQDDRRDFASVKTAVNAALSLRAVDAAGDVNAKSSIYTAAGGVSNATIVPSLSGSPGWQTNGANTKGDLIILGDFNSDAAFDGADLYLLARGASLSDNAATDHLTAASGATFADQLRNPNAKLNKNAALDFINAQLNNPANPDQLFLRQTARANATNDPNGVNAFNKFDVNRDGLVNRKDASIVDKFVGSDYHNLGHTLAATIANDGSVNPALPQVPINLVDAELDDDGLIRHILSSGTSDFKKIRDALGASLKDADANFDGTVSSLDFTAIATHFNTTGRKWSQGDFNFDGRVNALDFNALATNFGQTAPGEALSAFVPEPGALPTLFAAIGLTLSRKRRAS